MYDRLGQLQRTLDLGDASNHVQTTPNGKIWVGYFDEGVFGHSVGGAGLVCFDALGKPIFKYSEFAQRHELSFIDDCYAMNVVDDEEVWTSYYSEFPLVCIKNFQLEKVWKDFSYMDAFALVSDTVVFTQVELYDGGRKMQLFRRALAASSQKEQIEARDEQGKMIDGLMRGAGRGAHFYLWAGTGLYKMT